MVQTKEEKAAYHKAYYERTKERDKEKRNARNMVWTSEERTAYNKAYYERTKERDKEKIKARTKAYKQTPSGKKSNTLNNWKHCGVIGDLSKIYDERYIPSTNCEICNKEYSSTRDRHLDHCHETGLFRQVLCQNCNAMDNWKKYI